MTFTIIFVAGKLSCLVQTIEANDRHKALAIVQRLYPDSALGVVCTED